MREQNPHNTNEESLAVYELFLSLGTTKGMWCVLRRAVLRYFSRETLRPLRSGVIKKATTSRRPFRVLCLATFFIWHFSLSICFAEPPAPSMNRGGGSGISRGSGGGGGGRSGGMGLRLGPSYFSLSHRQSNASAVSYSALAPEINLTLPLSRSSFLEGGGYYTVMKISNSTLADITYMGGYGRLIVPFIPGRSSSLMLGLGAFYRSMTVSTEAFGYQDISGPDLSTYFDFTLKRKQKIQLGGRYGIVYTGEISASGAKEINGFLRIALPTKKNFFWFQFEYVKTSVALPTTLRTTVNVNSTVMRFSILFGK